MDPVLGSIISGVISGGASLLGGASSNAANARQAAEANQWSWNEQLNQQQFNAGQAAASRDFTQSLTTQAMDYNSAEAARQMSFQDTELGKAMAFNSSQAGLQRQYETEMSNTAYQRAVKDMRAAGLNPILSAGTGGASTPSVASPSVSVPGGAAGSVGVGGSATASSGIAGATRATMADVFSPAVSNALQAANVAMGIRRNIAEVDNINADTHNKLAGPSGSIAGVSVPVVRSIISDYGPAVKSALSRAGITTDAPVSSAIDAASKAASSIPGFDSADKAVREIMPAVEKAGRAARQTVDDWLSPGGTSMTPGNGAAPAAAKATNRLPGGGLQPSDLMDWARRTGRVPN